MTRPLSLRSGLRAVAVCGAVALGVVAVAQSWEELRSSADQLTVGTLLLALLAVLVGLLAGMLGWRTVMADLGSPLGLPAARIFFLGQLGKYVPGSVFALIAQMELGKDAGVPRSRSGAAGLIAVALGVVAGLLLAALTLPFVSGQATRQYWWVFLAVPLLGASLLPAVANPVLDRALRLARRGGLERRLTGRGMAVALGWSMLGWVGFGLQTWLLARALGAEGVALLPLSLGGFALAWTIGFLVVVAPAGAGVREVALVVALSPALGREEALLLALVSRALMTVGDLVWAALAVGLTAVVRRRAAPVRV